MAKNSESVYKLLNQLLDAYKPTAEKELKEIIGGIQPAILVPVHTLHPELEENPFGERILPKRGQTATL